ncbi:MAG: DUF6057 family protein [Bacteroidales bacterium]|nr:DUF6057 family protein [Bacteroidales bacterium]
MLKKFDKFAVFLAALFVVSFVCLYWLFPGSVIYQEMFQMFLWDKSYFFSMIDVPGGLASYITEFIVQFYYYPVCGAALVSIILVWVAWLTLRISRLFYDGVEPNILHTVPSLVLLGALGDPDLTHSILVAVVACLFLSWAGIRLLIRNTMPCRLAVLAIFPVAYFLIGPAVYIVLILLSAYIIKHRMGIVYVLGSALLLLLTILVCSRVFMYPVERFFYGIEYYRYHQCEPLVLIAIFASGISPIIHIPESVSRFKFFGYIQLALLLGFFYLACSHYPKYQHDTIYNLKKLQQGKFADVIEYYTDNFPVRHLQVQLLNGALAHEGRLLSEMFTHPQPDLETLLPETFNDMFTPLIMAETFFNMGLNLHAMHYYFESRTGDPTYRPSAMVTLRLAECHLIDNNSALATKYLLPLRKTLFYKGKANEYMEYLLQGRMSEHPFIAEKKQNTLKKNGIQALSTANVLPLLRNLMEVNPKNRMAYEYLMGVHLLSGDMEGVVEDISLAGQLQYTELPRHLQESLALYWYKTHNESMKGVPNVVSDYYVNQINMGVVPNDSFWHYYLKHQVSKK